MAGDFRALRRGLVAIGLATWISPCHADDWVIGNEAVVNVKVSSDTNPIPTAFPVALEQTRKLWRAYPKATQWLINIEWPAAPPSSAPSQAARGFRPCSPAELEAARLLRLGVRDRPQLGR